eukprot:1019963-Prymnesium_polylepis.1
MRALWRATRSERARSAPSSELSSSGKMSEYAYNPSTTSVSATCARTPSPRRPRGRGGRGAGAGDAPAQGAQEKGRG